MFMPKVAIIILNYNCWKDCVETVESVLKNDYDNFEVIVVDNCSTDDSWQKLNDWHSNFQSRASLESLALKAPKVSFYQNSVNNGFAGGNNFGIKIARQREADYFLILNPDVEVESNFLSELIKFAKEAPLQKSKVGFISPRIFYYYERRLIYSNGGKINWSLTKGELLDNGRDRSAIINNKNPFRTDYVSGTALLVAKEVLDDIGLMDETFFLYYEDTEWALRAAKKGYQHFIVPSSIIYHKESVSTKKFSYNYIYYQTRNALIMARQYGNFFIKIYLVFFIVQKAIKQIIKIIFWPSKRLWAKAILKGIWDFLKNKKGKIEISPSFTR